MIKKIILHLGIIISLLALWVFLIFLHFYLEHDGFFTLHYPHYTTFSTSNYDKELLKGEVIRGSFLAKENYLGILAFRFKIFERVNTDQLTFRFREKGKDRWYYINSYYASQIAESTFYTFGFPKISNSKGKLYEFEFESSRGVSGNAVAIENNEPIFISKYEIPKKLVFKNINTFILFFKEKLLFAIVDSDYLFAFLLYLFPLFFYFFWFLFLRRRIEEDEVVKGYYEILYRYKFLLILLIGLLIDIFFIKETYDLVIFILLVLWLFIAFFYKIRLSNVFAFIVPLLICSAVFTLLDYENFATKSAQWSYLLLWYCAIRLILEINPGIKKFVSLKW